MHGDVQADRLAEPRRPLGAQALGPLQHVEGGIERPFGIVLVGDRRTEQGEHRIPQVLGDEPAAAGDGLAQRAEQDALEGAHLLGIEAFGQGREAAKVGEQHGDRATVGVVRPLPGDAFSWL
jgi:hypothetical protein